MDLGFPNPWKATDTAIVIAALGAVLCTVAALWLQTLADRCAGAATALEIENIQEDNTQRQTRLAAVRSERRGLLERAALYRRSSSGAFILAVIAADVASLTWIAIPAMMLSAVLAFWYWWRYIRDVKIISRRLAVLEQIREVQAKSLSGPYVVDSVIYRLIDEVFTASRDRLDIIEDDVNLANILASDRLRSYNAARNATQDEDSS